MIFDPTTLTKVLTQARIRQPLLHRSCYMSQRTFFNDRKSRQLVEFDDDSLPEIVLMFMDWAGQSWVVGSPGTDLLSDWNRLFLAELLADEGL